jgi:Skp family chaperone for outer membrane proteins
LVTLAGGLGHAQEIGGVLVVDQERLFQDSAFGKRVLSELEGESQAEAAENRRIEAELRAEEQLLTDERPTMSPEDFRIKADAFDEKVQRIRAERDASLIALEALGEDERSRFFQNAAPILADILRERGGAVLMDRRAVLILADQIDITSEAIERIDAAIGDGAEENP